MPNFVWTSIDRERSTAELGAKYQALKGHGIDGVCLGGGIDEREFEVVREAGLELHCWMWTTNRGESSLREDHPDWFMVSRSGKSCVDQPPYVDYYRWLSPVIPGVRQYLRERADELASHSAVSGVHLDYVRYPDVILPRGLWEHYGLDQSEELADFDFCYSEHSREAFREQTGRDPMDIEDPAHDQEWLHFRYDRVTRLVKELHEEVKRSGKALTAAVFPTPRLARKICRQNWDKWPLDAAFPMLYNSFYKEPVEWIGECVLEDIQAAPFPIIPGLYMPDMKDAETFQQALRLVRRRGAAGVALFGHVGEELWRTFEANLAWNGG